MLDLALHLARVCKLLSTYSSQEVCLGATCLRNMRALRHGGTSKVQEVFCLEEAGFFVFHCYQWERVEDSKEMSLCHKVRAYLSRFGNPSVALLQRTDSECSHSQGVILANHKCVLKQKNTYLDLVGMCIFYAVLAAFSPYVLSTC